MNVDEINELDGASTYDSYHLTDINYSDFEYNARYISKEIFPFVIKGHKDMFINRNGKLAYYDYGGTGTIYTLKEVKEISVDNDIYTYLVKYTYPGHAEVYEEILKIQKQNGIFVIISYGEQIKSTEYAKIYADGDARHLITTYLNMCSTGTVEGFIEEVMNGYEVKKIDESDRYDNYQLTNVDYYQFEYNTRYISKEMYPFVIKGKKDILINRNGKLAYYDFGESSASNIVKEVKEIKQISVDNDIYTFSVKYTSSASKDVTKLFEGTLKTQSKGTYFVIVSWDEE